MRITHFGADPETWNIGETYENQETDGDGSYMPGVMLFGDAVREWAVRQGRPVSVMETALAFNVTTELVEEAIRDHHRLDLENGSIVAGARRTLYPLSDRDALGQALQVWSNAQDREKVNVQEAALAFNVGLEEIRQAVNDHYWMFVGAGDTIEHDGE